MLYVNTNVNEDVFFLRNCDGTAKFLGNSMAFMFAPIGPWISSLAAFTFAFVFGAPHCVYMLFQLLSYSRTTHMES